MLWDQQPVLFLVNYWQGSSPLEAPFVLQNYHGKNHEKEDSCLCLEEFSQIPRFRCLRQQHSEPGTSFFKIQKAHRFLLQKSTKKTPTYPHTHPHTPMCPCVHTQRYTHTQTDINAHHAGIPLSFLMHKSSGVLCDNVINYDQCFCVCSVSALTATWDITGWETVFNGDVPKFHVVADSIKEVVYPSEIIQP